MPKVLATYVNSFGVENADIPAKKEKKTRGKYH